MPATKPVVLDAPVMVAELVDSVAVIVAGAAGKPGCGTKY
jgi:hypothetical protein